MRAQALFPLAAGLCAISAVWWLGDRPREVSVGSFAPLSAREPAALETVLATLPDRSNTDDRVRAAQAEIRESGPTLVRLERLGWLFVERARRLDDPGDYKLAELCADAIEQLASDSLEAALLRGHALQNLHRFSEAEPIARQLVERRGLAVDHGLLGDVLLDQGQLADAAVAYQQMVDLKPDAHAYRRVAHLRYLNGDVDGAVSAMRLATGASSPRAPSIYAWSHSRLGLYELQRGNRPEARRAIEAAVLVSPDDVGALHVQGRYFLAEDRPQDALTPLARAAQLQPLPDILWTYAETLRAVGEEAQARRIEQQIAIEGPRRDPRNCALFLAHTATDVERAATLATAELNERRDVYTLDAAAVAALANGNVDEAQRYIELALAVGTQDARLFLHAGQILSATGNRAGAERWLTRARGLEQLLLPSEREQLQKLSAPS